MCPHKDIPVGVGLNVVLVGNLHCALCGGSEFPHTTVRAIYRGHYTDGDTYALFKLVGVYRCPSCYELVTSFSERCDGGGLWADLFTEVIQNVTVS